MAKIKHHYSGKKSKNFWDVINSLSNKCDQFSLYSLGCALQNLERYVLEQLENALKSSIKNDN